MDGKKKKLTNRGRGRRPLRFGELLVSTDVDLERDAPELLGSRI